MTSWITRCGDCPMWKPEDHRNVTGDCLASPIDLRVYKENAITTYGDGCAEPLRMAIAAGHQTVAAFVAAREEETT